MLKTSEKLCLVGTYLSSSRETVGALGKVNEGLAGSWSDSAPSGFKGLQRMLGWNDFNPKLQVLLLLCLFLFFFLFFFASSKVSNQFILPPIAFANQSMSSFFFCWVGRHWSWSLWWFHWTFCWLILSIFAAGLSLVSSVPLLGTSSSGTGFFQLLFQIEKEGRALFFFLGWRAGPVLRGSRSSAGWHFFSDRYIFSFFIPYCMYGACIMVTTGIQKKELNPGDTVLLFYWEVGLMQYMVV